MKCSAKLMGFGGGAGLGLSWMPYMNGNIQRSNSPVQAISSLK